jgi:hypothetical protein
VTTLASFCLGTELVANVVRFVWFVTDPAQMRGVFPIEARNKFVWLLLS